MNDSRTGRPSKLSATQGDGICCRLANGETTSSLAREFGIAKSTISEWLALRVKTIKALAIRLVRAEVSEQMADQSPAERTLSMQLLDGSLALTLAELRNRYGRHRGRHSEPWGNGLPNWFPRTGSDRLKVLSPVMNS
jgi:transposase-like protein